MNYVLFSIDNVNNTYDLSKFLRYMDNNVILGKTKGRLIHCIGMYEDKLEQSFICNREDYNNFVEANGFTKNQKAVIDIEGKRMNCFIGEDFIGRLVEVSKKKAFKSEGFTYRPDMNKYWVIK